MDLSLNYGHDPAIGQLSDRTDRGFEGKAGHFGYVLPPMRDLLNISVLDLAGQSQDHTRDAMFGRRR